MPTHQMEQLLEFFDHLQQQYQDENEKLAAEHHDELRRMSVASVAPTTQTAYDFEVCSIETKTPMGMANKTPTAATNNKTSAIKREDIISQIADHIIRERNKKLQNQQNDGNDRERKDGGRKSALDHNIDFYQHEDN